MTATSLRSAKRLMISVPSISRIRAEAWASEVLIGICQPCQERAWMPMPCSTIASRPEVTCSPDATTASYSRASCSGEASRHQSTSSLVLPAMADTTTATSCPASTSRLTWRATLRIRSILATDVPPNFITRRPMTTRAFLTRLNHVACVQNPERAGRKARIHSGAVAGKQPGSGTPRNVLISNGLMAVEADCMGRYIDDILQPGEKVLYSTNAHWIFFLPAITGWVVAIVFLVLSRMVATDTLMLLCWSMAAIAAIFALYKTAFFFNDTATTE